MKIIPPFTKCFWRRRKTKNDTRDEKTLEHVNDMEDSEERHRMLQNKKFFQKTPGGRKKDHVEMGLLKDVSLSTYDSNDEEEKEICDNIISQPGRVGGEQKNSEGAVPPTDIHDIPCQIVRGTDGKLYYIQNEHQMTYREYKDRHCEEMGIDSKVHKQQKSGRTSKQTAQSQKTKRKQRVTVIVEDASDKENEDDMNSFWRNRHPSPGQWMEPVDHFFVQ